MVEQPRFYAVEQKRSGGPGPAWVVDRLTGEKVTGILLPFTAVERAKEMNANHMKEVSE